MIVILLSLSFLVSENSFSQEIEWQKTIGGGGNDELHSICKSREGGFLLGGFSHSGISGDKTDSCRGGDDFWVVKISSVGDIEWQNTIGGQGDDWLFSVTQAKDGGFFLGGGSNSPISGDKTDSCFGEKDFWIIRLNIVGNIQWQKVFGGVNNEIINSVSPTMDNGCLVGGASNSSISGNKTDNVCSNSYDYWVLKLDEFGNVQWQKSIGGGDDDWLVSVIQARDSGFVLVGASGSSASCDKTEGCIGVDDFWIVKLNSTGSMIWQNTIGGTQADELTSIVQTNDGGYICGGYSNSSASFDKTESTCNNSADWWILKLDSLGNILWQRTYGGADVDYLSSISLGYNGDIYVGGTSSSDSSCYKNENNVAVHDYWMAKLDSTGNLIWQNTIGGTAFDRFYPLQATFDNGCIGGGWSNSGISGDKADSCKGGWDYWLVKLENNYNLISGKLFCDLNSNGVLDLNESFISNKKIVEFTTGDFSFSDFGGRYNIAVFDTGNYIVSPKTFLWYYASPSSQGAYFNTLLQTDSLNDFALQPSGSYDDLSVTITPLIAFRSGFNAMYQINYSNIGTTTLSPTVYFYQDTNLTFQSASLTPSQITTDSIVWNLPPLAPFQSGSIIITVTVNNGVPIGTLINSSAHIDPAITDANVSNNTSDWPIYTTGSFDPNDIIVDRSDFTTTELSTSPWLEYIIRFQNTGNDTAFTVKILNPIDTNKLDISSIEFVNASHPVNLNWINYQRNMEFKFDNILLPDSNTNEPLSHGFVRYRIQPKTTLSAGDTIPNFAAIYFDFNEPVITNTAKTIIVLPTGLSGTNASPGKLLVFPNPAENSISISGIQLENGKAHLRLMDIYGKLIFEKTVSEKTANLETNQLANGVYLIQSGGSRATFVKQ